MIIKNIRTLKSLQKKYNFTFDEDKKYILNYDEKLMYNYDKEYKIEFLDGCFYPYIIKTNREKLKCLSQLYHDGVNYYDIRELHNGDWIVIFNKSLAKDMVDFLNNKYFNIEFGYKIKSEYAPEATKDCIYVKNKMEV